MNNIEQQLRTYINPEKQEVYPRFFKTGKGEYGEGDLFLGITVPDIRKIAKVNETLTLEEIKEVLISKYHECRHCALVILVNKFKGTKADEEKEEIYNFYLSNTQYINNWDLVDVSAKDIVGGYLLNKKDRGIL